MRVYPTDGAVFYTPVNIPILACAQDVDGFVTSVEFFADDVSLGVISNQASIPPPVIGPEPPLLPMPPYRPFVLVWSNAAVGPHVLTAKATDNGGATTLSALVNIAVNPGPPPPPPNFRPIVRITSPANNSMFRAPVNIPVLAFATDLGGPVTTVTNVEFFAGTNDLGTGYHARTEPLPLPPGPIQPPIIVFLPTGYWELVWSNASQGDYPLTAVATDDRGAYQQRLAAVTALLIRPPVRPLNALSSARRALLRWRCRRPPARFGR